mmetsp:Transcript_3367/g.4927  ORF Transcript_3367/g.4927 Transcript_3367/m.4927 type:complete len:170 (+) Transcript_3367:114-623(+)
MKCFSTSLALLSLIGSTQGFAVSSSRQATATSSSSSTRLGLFGGGGKDGEKKGPNMMDQLAMFKKAQEVASKKQDIDKEIANLDIVGNAADGKVTAQLKYLPPQAMNPTPTSEISSVTIDQAYFDDVSCEDLGTALVEAIRDGEKNLFGVVNEKYEALGKELQDNLKQN